MSPSAAALTSFRDEHPNLVPGPSATGSERKMETEVERRKEMKIKREVERKEKRETEKRGGEKQKGNEEREREKGKVRKIKR